MPHERCPTGVERGLPARAPHDRAHGRPGRVLRRASDSRRPWATLLRLGAARGPRGRGRGLGVEPSGSRRGRPRAGHQVGRSTRNDRAGRDPPALRRRRAAPCRLRAAPPAPGLTGLEFGVNIPGTVGGAVRMNANAYGGELARVLEWVDVVSAEGTERRAPDELGFAYRRSNLGAGEVVARASFALAPAEPESVKATLADMRGKRAARPSPRASRPSARPSRTPTTPAPRGAAPASCSTRPAAAACRSAARASPRSTPTSSRTRARRPRPTCWR